jgi:hypothetical protein
VTRRRNAVLDRLDLGCLNIGDDEAGWLPRLRVSVFRRCALILSCDRRTSAGTLQIFDVRSF